MNAQPTSINAYYDFKDSTKHLKQKELVLAAFKELGVASDAAVQRLTGMGIRQCSTRRNEHGSLIIKCGTQIDAVSGFEVATYKINPAPALFVVKKKSNADRLKEIKKLCEERFFIETLGEKILKIINS